MPATALDPKTALVVIDFQKGIAAVPTVHPMKEMAARAGQLAAAFRAASLPVIWVNVSFHPDEGDKLANRTDVVMRASFPPGFDELMDELGVQPGDLRITKRQPNAFHGTELDLQLRRRGITGIVLCGVSTSVGVDSTARAAHERGYNVTFALDATTDRDPELHEVISKKMFPRWGEVDSSDKIIALLPPAR